ncbi:3-oxoacyl-ACP synthase III family protein [Planktosalinus lacus]|uniref:3-oxoacyl-ACP synthase n=1 Tax=Planktosalinus lacus TaxID=1526573 RepID=A0A8J2V921_9FLAO|nr:ketoacyl-ACP synthase III [Planktosalinus lacus]GGD87118.1 3-oxoacyl-ACP synthase [Planktosalinus lacus]
MDATVKITGIGSYIPDTIATNESFISNRFLNEDGSEIKDPNPVIIEKFKAITGINARRYIEKNLVTSDIAFFAAEKAIAHSGINPETINYIIVAHNYGDVKHLSNQSDTVPSLASRVKHLLQIENPRCVGYDVLFGCPGWLEGVIQANAFIKAGIAETCLIIGAEALSRVIDQHDRDSMIYSDGAGAVILQKKKESGGIISHETVTHTRDEAHFIYFDRSNQKQESDKIRYIKMYGRKVYNFALTNVPLAMKSCLDKSGVSISDIKKIFIHQANEKMDEAICQRFYKLYDMEMPKDIMPMSIGELGNSSVATIPTLLDLVSRKKMSNHEVKTGDHVIFASVGAGMNINAVVYQF